MDVVQISVRVDKKLRDEAQKVFEKQGLDVSTVMRMLITKTVYEQEIPMSIHTNSSVSLDSDWLSDKRVNARKVISDILSEKKSKKLDFSNQVDVDEFFSEN